MSSQLKCTKVIQYKRSYSSLYQIINFVMMLEIVQSKLFINSLSFEAKLWSMTNEVINILLTALLCAELYSCIQIAANILQVSLDPTLLKDIVYWNLPKLKTKHKQIFLVQYCQSCSWILSRIQVKYQPLKHYMFILNAIKKGDNN